MLIFRIFWWSWWVMFWGIILFLLFGCATQIDKEYRMVREMRDADCQPEIVKVSWERQTFELACK